MKLKNNLEVDIIEYNKDFLPTKLHIKGVQDVLVNTYSQNPEQNSLKDSLNNPFSSENIIHNLQNWEDSQNRKTSNQKLFVIIDKYKEKILGYLYTSERNYLNSEDSFDEIINYRVLREKQWLGIWSLLYKTYDQTTTKDMQYLLVKRWSVSEKIYLHLWFEYYNEQWEKDLDFIHMVKYRKK